MDDNEEDPSGALYQLGDEGCVRRDPGYVVTNGPAESPDGRVLYHTDTLAGVIYAFDRARSGTLSNKRVFARLPAGAGYPGRSHRGCGGLPLDRACSAAGACIVIHPTASC